MVIDKFGFEISPRFYFSNTAAPPSAQEIQDLPTGRSGRNTMLNKMLSTWALPLASPPAGLAAPPSPLPSPAPPVCHLLSPPLLLQRLRTSERAGFPHGFRSGFGFGPDHGGGQWAKVGDRLRGSWVAGVGLWDGIAVRRRRGMKCATFTAGRVPGEVAGDVRRPPDGANPRARWVWPGALGWEGGADCSKAFMAC